MTASVYGDQRFYGLFDVSEAARRPLTHIDWSRFDDSKVDDRLLQSVHRAVLAEITTYEATERFMEGFAGDSDFTQWLSIWFYEETTHPHALLRWLDHFGVALDEDAVLQARSTEPFVASRIGTLAINLIAEIVAADGYLRLARASPEPVLADIARHLARDEARHASGFLVYLREHLRHSEAPEDDRRTMLKILYLWSRTTSRVTHPGMLLLHDVELLEREGVDALVGQPPPSTRNRICRLFGLVLGEDDLRTPDDIRPVLRRGDRVVAS